MSIAFSSNHLSGQLGAGLLVDLALEDVRRGVTRYDRLSFGVPPDFHAHPDVLAAALLAIVGPNYPSVRFNFAISPACAERLTGYYQLAEIGPVDEQLPPRAPGRDLALSFSGGVDSLVIYLLLRRLGIAVKVVSADFGGWFEGERLGFSRLPRDITCSADFRVKGYGQHSIRSTAATTMLFADYLDLAGIMLGVKMDDDLNAVLAPPAQQEGGFHRYANALAAAGLAEIAPIRGLMTPGALHALLELAPDFVETALLGAARPGTQKFFGKALLTRRLYQQRGRPLPRLLRDIVPPERAAAFGHDVTEDLTALYIARYIGLEPARLATPGIERHDLGFLDALSLDFYLKYNPNHIDQIPADLRDALLGAWHALGLYPYDERDWEELNLVRAFLDATRSRAVRERWLTPEAARSLRADPPGR